MSKFRVDVGYFKMVVDYYNRKCPCWGGKYFCPCPPFVETRECRCGAVRDMDDPKAQKARYKNYTISFDLLTRIVNSGYVCPEGDITCFCEDFLETGKCKLNVFEKSE